MVIINTKLKNMITIQRLQMMLAFVKDIIDTIN